MLFHDFSASELTARLFDITKGNEKTLSALISGEFSLSGGVTSTAALK